MNEGVAGTAAGVAHRRDGGDGAPRALTKDEFEVEFAAVYRSMLVLAASVGGREGAEDVVGDAAIVAIKKLGSFERGSNFGAWMATIVRNVARNASRGERRRVLRLRLFSHESMRRSKSDRTRDERFTPELQRMLDSLAGPQRECFVLRAALSHSYDEISAITGIPTATARSHVLRARRRLLEMAGSEVSDAD